jgi:hypothetical protein
MQLAARRYDPRTLVVWDARYQQGTAAAGHGPLGGATVYESTKPSPGEPMRLLLATTATVVLIGAFALLLWLHLDPLPGVVSLGCLAGSLMMLGVAADRLGSRAARLALALAGGVVAVLAGWSGAAAFGWAPAIRWGVIVAAVAVAQLAVGRSSAFGASRVGGIATLALAAGWAVGALARLPNDRLGALMAVVSVVVVGLLPRFGLVQAGLGALGGRPRGDLGGARAAAHRGMAAATVTASICAALAASMLVTTPTPWTLGLTGAVAVILAARSRNYPLPAEVGAMVAAAVSVLLILLFAWADTWTGFPYAPLGLLLLVAALPLALFAAHIRSGAAARWHRIVDAAESVAFLSLLVLAAGVLGAFGAFGAFG